ncbi:MAG: hypothetical protein R2839_09280 [Thermomicrobiales bacterium]
MNPQQSSPADGPRAADGPIAGPGAATGIATQRAIGALLLSGQGGAVVVVGAGVVAGGGGGMVGRVRALRASTPGAATATPPMPRSPLSTLRREAPRPSILVR